MGYNYVLAYDHVLGAEPGNRARAGAAPTTIDTPFHEPFVLFAYLAARHTTHRVRHRHHHPAAAPDRARRQAGGGGRRAHAAAGCGWASASAGTWSSTRRSARTSPTAAAASASRSRSCAGSGRRSLVDFNGKWHRLDRVGIRPLPVQRPIPIWIGGMSEPVLKRLARIADGWLPQFNPTDPTAKETMERLHGYIRAAGRKIEDVGIDGRINFANSNPEDWAAQMEAWRELGATHVGVNTMNSGQTSPRAHIEAIQRFKDGVGDLA